MSAAVTVSVWDSRVSCAPVASSLTLAVYWPARGSTMPGARGSLLAPTTLAGPGVLPAICTLAEVKGGVPERPGLLPPPTVQPA